MTAFDRNDFDTVLVKRVISDGESVTCETRWDESDETWDLAIWTGNTVGRHLVLSQEQAVALIAILTVLFPEEVAA